MRILLRPTGLLTLGMTMLHEDFDAFGGRVCSIIRYRVRAAWEIIAWAPGYDWEVRGAIFSPSFNWISAPYMLSTPDEVFTSMGPDLGRLLYRNEVWTSQVLGVDPGRKQYQERFERQRTWGPL